MKYDDFLVKVEEHYTPYETEGDAYLVQLYIEENFKEEELEKVLLKLVIKHPKIYKTPPDVGKLNEIFGEKETDIEAKAQAAWSKVNNNLHCYNPIFFEDLRLQACIEGLGGWVKFCQRSNDPEQDKWVLKEFVRLYKLYSKEEPLVRHRILPGLSYVRGIDDPNLIMIGDKDNCKLLLNPPSEKSQEEKNTEQITDALSNTFTDVRRGNGSIQPTV